MWRARRAPGRACESACRDSGSRNQGPYSVMMLPRNGEAAADPAGGTMSNPTGTPGMAMSPPMRREARPGAGAISAASQTTGWLRGWVFAVVVVLTLVTVLTAFTEDMPESHHAAA